MPSRRPRPSAGSRATAAVVAAILLAAVVAEYGRRSKYRDRLDYHLGQLEGCPPPPTRGLFRQLPQEAQSRLVRAWIHHAAMGQKYRTALSVPLFFVPPDPPEP